MFGVWGGSGGGEVEGEVLWDCCGEWGLKGKRGDRDKR